MYLSLEATNFRNLDLPFLSFSSGVNIIIGENGQGKSNILEALSLSSEGDSFRIFETENLVKFNEDNSNLRVKALVNDLDFEIRTIITKNKIKRIINDKETAAQKEFLTNIVFSPESLNSIKDSADSRRQLVDQFLQNLTESDSNSVKNYRKALKFRNKILAAISSLENDGVAKRQSIDMLDSFNEKFLNYATELTLRRIQLLKDLEKDFSQSLESMFYSKKNTGQENYEIKPIGSFGYVISGHEQIHNTNREIHNSMRNRLDELRTAEYSSGTSLIGPHRHDLKILYNGKDSRFYCSQGQQRSLIIAFKLAQIMYHRRVRGNYPVLMLDDVLSELDEGKRIQLVRFLQEIKAQVFITTTDVKLPLEFSKKNSQVIYVSNGNASIDTSYIFNQNNP